MKKRIFIDLTGDDAPTAPASASTPGSGVAHGANATQEIINIASDSDDDDRDVCVGAFRTEIVGLRFYHGIINDDEHVVLIREPLNQYDANAIRYVF
jgi:SWI/SNF-related matrix-associated actin-dependent regulator of chromatin subfamily A3